MSQRFSMFGGTALLTIDELVEKIVPELKSGTKRRKMSRYQAIYHAMQNLLHGLGSDKLGPLVAQAVYKAMERAASLNDALVGQPDDEAEDRKIG